MASLVLEKHGMSNEHGTLMGFVAIVAIVAVVVLVMIGLR